MKKLVNGVVVDIDNISLFEKAAESVALSKITTSDIENKPAGDNELASMCIEAYKALKTSLPYPLYLVECNAKYAATAAFIKFALGSEISMWIDESLKIRIDNEDTILKILGNTWGIEHETSEKEFKSMQEYSGQVGYREFSWVLKKITNGEDTSSFYEDVMPSFYSACNGDMQLIKWELYNILNFGEIEEEKELVPNVVTDIRTGETYIVDIFKDGKSNKNKTEITYYPNLGRIDRKIVKDDKYNFEVYKRVGTNNGGESKLAKARLDGALSLYSTVMAIKDCLKIPKIPEFRAIIVAGKLVFEVNKQIFMSEAHSKMDKQEVAKDTTIYSYDTRSVYLVKRRQIGVNLFKEVIFKYDVFDYTSRICRIQFVSRTSK